MKDVQELSFEGTHCANCNELLQGEFCHHCGQSVHSVLKPVHGMLEEAAETLLHIDGRIVHTLPPLLLNPGFLTLEYFSGRRMRYIAPFRLMFVICVLTFFVCHLAIDRVTHKFEEQISRGPVVTTSDDITTATTPKQVRAALKEQLDGLNTAKDTGVLPPAAVAKINEKELMLSQQANQRLITLGAAPMPASSLTAPPADSVATAASVSTTSTTDDMLDGTHLKMQTVHISWLPDIANERLTVMLSHFLGNLHAFKHGDAATREETKQRMIDGVFSELPPAMFVMIPVFAILLKLFYLFKRRLYMEHLITALHSHAFLFLSLLLIALLGMLSTWLRPHAAWVGYPLGWLQTALMLWVPVYLLVMQKRIYRQGWPMTVLKFWFIGWFYFWLLLIALLIAAALGATH
ncbi:MAG: DUF3667 domain-containing protein [Rhodanobacter sp.]